ncbi:hypothetical protein [Anaeromyxobacter oryzae]|uniref:Uncharacterized protein n=1 Tax=Anaeromyxobacter oryzae TaxID=2918170 RepID=A0ABM7WX65_9BACT|nr:hypothetical protein [Anaeromyxobacter oryzae]BDG04062.1 hypothetical protein AMOR_30580 [Anaeromyxobacter oryzae]
MPPADDPDAIPWPPPTGVEAALLAGGAALLAWSQVTRGLVAAALAGADLVFHEAGHVVCGVLGLRFVTLLGGTLGQLAFPVAAGLGFALRRRTVAAAAMIVWFGVNLVDIGTYAADAEARVLPLLAPDRNAHDWWQMLGMLGIRERCEGIGGTLQALGWALQGAAPAWAVALWCGRRSTRSGRTAVRDA